jgi:hypothetical protein
MKIGIEDRSQLQLVPTSSFRYGFLLCKSRRRHFLGSYTRLLPVAQQKYGQAAEKDRRQNPCCVQATVHTTVRNEILGDIALRVPTHHSN